MRRKQRLVYERCFRKSKVRALNTYWHEQGLLIYSEFCDGNIPAEYEQLRCFKASLLALPKSVKHVRLRSDSAGYQHELVSYCAEGKDERFGVIKFAVSTYVSVGLKTAAAQVKSSDWQPIYKKLSNGQSYKTDQEWAELCYVLNWVEEG